MAPGHHARFYRAPRVVIRRGLRVRIRRARGRRDHRAPRFGDQRGADAARRRQAGDAARRVAHDSGGRRLAGCDPDPRAVTTYVVRLMDGATVVREIAPVGVGEQVDTGEYASTQTGLFYVNSKIEELAYDPPYDTYISHWVGFDETKANGFHSFLKDANGAVVDPSTGRVSNGCIRTGEAEAVFAFAEIGMPVWVHW